MHNYVVFMHSHTNKGKVCGGGWILLIFGLPAQILEILEQTNIPRLNPFVATSTGQAAGLRHSRAAPDVHGSL